MATNIAAIGYIGKDLHSQRSVFLNGLFYALGNVVSYSLLGVVMVLLIEAGGSAFKIQQWISWYGGYILGPFIILMGILMFDFIRWDFSFLSKSKARMEAKARNANPWSSFLIGVVFALAFCPNSAVLFFGALIPLSVATTHGVWLPVVFSLATALPVIITAWILAYSVARIGIFYQKIRSFEIWFRRSVALVFVLVGVYFIFKFYF